MIDKDRIETYEKKKMMFKITCTTCGEEVRGTSQDQLLHTFSVHTQSKKHRKALEDKK